MTEVYFSHIFLCRFRTAPLEVGLGQEPDFARVDRSPAVGIDRAAHRRRLVGLFEAEVG